MARADPDGRAVYELPLASGEPAGGPGAGTGSSASLPQGLLIGNALWFVRLRWVAVSLLLVFGGLGLFASERFASLGLRPPHVWPLVIAGILGVANLAFLVHARRLEGQGPGVGPAANLWAQIVVDLLALTAAVHFLGSLETPVAFMYLGHIVLACIFFSRRQSLAVAGLASGLYGIGVGLQGLGILAGPGIYLQPLLPPGASPHPTLLWVTVGATLGIFCVVWYLASHLSALVRARDLALAEANRRLTLAQVEKTRHMLQTTHELKAPFAAIAANVQLLLLGSCGPLPPAAVEVLERIAARCRRLSHEIQQMLQLSNLRSPEERPARIGLDLAALIRWAAAGVEPTAQLRRVRLEVEATPTPIVAVEDHVKMVAANLLSNAVAYSREGGVVRVVCGAPPGEGPRLVVEDEGIGIAPEKLPRIFDDYYRTEEGVRHNKEATGLGLAIVRHVARSHGIQVRVESGAGRGTRVTLRFPAGGGGRGPHEEGEPWPIS